MKKLISLILIAIMVFATFAAAIHVSAETTSGTCGDDLTWEFDTETGTLTISGSGPMTDYAVYYLDASPWYSFSTDVKFLKLLDGVTSIGNYAFVYCTNLEDIMIPDSISSVGSKPFPDELSLPFNTYDAADYIGNSDNPYVALIKPLNQDITQCRVHEKARAIASDAFYHCESLASVTISCEACVIPYGLFCGCPALKSVSIGGAVEEIQTYAFATCTSLETVYLFGTPYICKDAFSGDQNIKEIYFYGTEKEWDLVRYTAEDGNRYFVRANVIFPVGKIEYHLNGGTNSAKNPATYDSTVGASLHTPTRKGYTFKGWYTDSGFKNKVTKIAAGTTGEVKLYAKWERATYKITYKLNNGKNSSKNPSKYTYSSSSSVSLHTPTRKGYVIKGWYTDSKFKTKVTKIKAGTTGDVKLYAKWERATYKITYKLNNGKNSSKNPSKYTYSSSSSVSLHTPTR
ncbi:MAG: InlB B-repeat-containing protein, partial [Clostridia bacterium]|nr:InlB B-repeat-containing protein [Clostridia bacterium]